MNSRSKGEPRLSVFTLVKVDARADKYDKQDRGEGGCGDPCRAAGNESGERGGGIGSECDTELVELRDAEGCCRGGRGADKNVGPSLRVNNSGNAGNDQR